MRPGPGLTLDVGRNGSGKSSFAEGLEYLLTGRNYRWEKRPKVWLEGWRNLHHDRAALKADLLVEGRGSVSVARTWTSNDLAANQIACVGPDKKPESVHALGWSDALVTFRPFLSYNELGSLLEEGPSKLYDALSKVLGLEDLVAVQTRLAAARKERQELVELASAGAVEVRALVNSVDADSRDERVEPAKKAEDRRLHRDGHGEPPHAGTQSLTDLVACTVSYRRQFLAACGRLARFPWKASSSRRRTRTSRGDGFEPPRSCERQPLKQS